MCCREIYSKSPVSTTDDERIWCPTPPTSTQDCKFLKSEHHNLLYSLLKKSIIIGRAIQYVKDRTEYCFDDYFPCSRRKPKCKLKHVSIG
jgi:hypothetical protein